MFTVDPLFAVRIVSDPPGAWATWGPGIMSLVGVLIGGLTTYFATVGVERRREREETRLLALSIAAEARAGRFMLQRQMEVMAPMGQAFANQTMRYTMIPEDYAPIAKAAAPKAGRLPRKIADALAKCLILMQNIRQHQQTIAAMHMDGVLTDEELGMRLIVLAPIALELPNQLDAIVSLVDAHYGVEDRPWYRRLRTRTVD